MPGVLLGHRGYRVGRGELVSGVLGWFNGSEKMGVICCVSLSDTPPGRDGAPPGPGGIKRCLVSVSVMYCLHDRLGESQVISRGRLKREVMRDHYFSISRVFLG